MRRKPSAATHGTHGLASSSAVFAAEEPRTVVDGERLAVVATKTVHLVAKVAPSNDLLSSRPPALEDPLDRTDLDAETRARYSARAARSMRLNDRLTQRITELEAEMAAAHGEKRTQLAKELELLRQNLAQRQQFEREVAPAPGARPISK